MVPLGARADFSSVVVKPEVVIANEVDVVKNARFRLMPFGATSDSYSMVVWKRTWGWR